MNGGHDYSHIAAQITQFPERQDHEAQRAKAKFLRDWKLVKSARFNASQRLDRKEQASLFAITLGGALGIFVGPLEQSFASYLTPYTLHVIKYVAYVAGFLSFILGLTGQVKGYTRRARNLDLCAKEINAISKDLRITPISTAEELRPFISRYNHAIKMYEDNHDNRDYELAKLHADMSAVRRNMNQLKPDNFNGPPLTDIDPLERRMKQLKKEVKKLKRGEYFDIYGIHGAVWGLPITLGFIFLVLFPLQPLQ